MSKFPKGTVSKPPKAKFPIKWLTYKRRIANDLDRLFQDYPTEAKSIFDTNYLAVLSQAILRTEDWILKLYSIQIAITAFFVLGFISDNPAISLFGVSLGGIAGLKEILLVVWFTIGLAAGALASSRDMLTMVAKKIVEKNSNKAFAYFSSLTVPSPFNIYIYITRPFENWIFTTFATKLLTFLIALFLIIAFMVLLLFSLTLSIYLLHEVYVHPTLGRWSYALLAYSCLVLATGLLLIVRVNVPMPYRDHSDLKLLSILEKTDPAKADQLRRKIFS